jgi:hypothetical protein
MEPRTEQSALRGSAELHSAPLLAEPGVVAARAASTLRLTDDSAPLAAQREASLPVRWDSSDVPERLAEPRLAAALP